MQKRNKILRMTRFYIVYIIVIMIIGVFLYKEKNNKEYTYIINNAQGKSENCYVNDYDFRLCEVKDKLIMVEMFYEEN